MAKSVYYVMRRRGASAYSTYASRVAHPTAGAARQALLEIAKAEHAAELAAGRPEWPHINERTTERMSDRPSISLSQEVRERFAIMGADA